MDDQAREVISTWDRLDGDRSNWRVHWQECADYMQPERRDYNNKLSPGTKRMQNIYDATPVWALQQFAAGVHSLLTSPTLPWFYLRPEDDSLSGSNEAGAWLDDATQRMYKIFAGSKHNFAAQSNELYADLGLIGTGVMAVLESARSGILFTTRHLKECVIQENEEDRVDTLVRRWSYTAKQAFQAFGVKAGEKVLKALDDERGGSRPFDFLHMVRPRLKRDITRADKRNKAFESVYVSAADGTVISEGGFDEFPYVVPRYMKASGEVYGRSLGMVALPDVKMLNEMAKTVMKAAQKVVDPPLQVPDDGFLMSIKSVPGAINYYRPGSRDRVEPIKTGGDVQLGIEMLNHLRQAIIRTFMVDWMLMASDPNDPASAGKGVTATYVLRDRDEKMRLLSPMFARLQSEFLGPLIDRVFAIMWRQSAALKFGPGALLAPPPAALSGVKLRVEYVSPIAVAQRTSQLDSVARLIQTALLLGQVDPETPRILDAEGILRLSARDLNTPSVTLKTPERVAAERQAASQATAAAQDAQQRLTAAQAMQHGTKAIQNLAAANSAASQTEALATAPLNDNLGAGQAA